MDLLIFSEKKSSANHQNHHPSYAKQLIEDTIRRNASPMRSDDTLSSGGGVAGAGSCSSLTSSNSDDQLKLHRSNIVTTTNISHVPKSRSASGTNALMHSLSSNDTSLGEYKFTVNVGHQSIKITGDNIELVRVRHDIAFYIHFCLDVLVIYRLF